MEPESIPDRLNFLSPGVMRDGAGLLSASGSNALDASPFCTTEFALGVAMRDRTMALLQLMELANVPPLGPFSRNEIGFMEASTSLAEDVASLRDSRLPTPSSLFENDPQWHFRSAPRESHVDRYGTLSRKYFREEGAYSPLPLQVRFAQRDWDEVNDLLGGPMVDGCRGQDCGILGQTWWSDPPPSCSSNVWRLCCDRVSNDPSLCVRGAVGILAKQICIPNGGARETLVLLGDSEEPGLYACLSGGGFWYGGPQGPSRVVQV
jgi:hypothetical protein